MIYNKIPPRLITIMQPTRETDERTNKQYIIICSTDLMKIRTNENKISRVTIIKKRLNEVNQGNERKYIYIS